MVYLAVALGGAVGAVLRWALGDAVPDGAGFPWTTFADQRQRLAGARGTAGLRRRTPPPGPGRRAGPGLLGGYTTLSAYSEQTRALLAGGQTATALLYLLGTLAACLVAVAAVSRLYPPAAGDECAAEGGDE